MIFFKKTMIFAFFIIFSTPALASHVKKAAQRKTLSPDAAANALFVRGLIGTGMFPLPAITGASLRRKKSTPTTAKPSTLPKEPSDFYYGLFEMVG